MFLQDMKKFGGPNKMRQKCRLRQCLLKSRVMIIYLMELELTCYSTAKGPLNSVLELSKDIIIY